MDYPKPPHSPLDAVSAKTPEAPLPLPRMLLVEDNPVNRHIALAMLKGLPMEIQAAENGAQAVAAVTQKRFALVLMDCHMPGMDGFEATRAIRRLFPSHALPIIALTANNTPDDRERCLKAGMNDFLPKPFDKDSIVNMVTRWLPVQRN